MKTKWISVLLSFILLLYTSSYAAPYQQLEDNQYTGTEVIEESFTQQMLLSALRKVSTIEELQQLLIEHVDLLGLEGVDQEYGCTAYQLYTERLSDAGREEVRNVMPAAYSGTAIVRYRNSTAG